MARLREKVTIGGKGRRNVGMKRPASGFIAQTGVGERMKGLVK